MKKIIFASIFAIALLASCSNNKATDGKSDSATTVLVPTGGKSDSATSKTDSANGNSGTQIASAKYQCPMQCEGPKTYDKPGKCPECGMEMKEVK